MNGGLKLAAGAYLVLMNLTALMTFGIDKRRARRGAWRVPERTMFLLAILGGSAGAIAGMKLFHHKTRHWYFRYGLPAILLAQAVMVYRFLFA